MNEWGLPDWLEPSSYGETTSWDWYRWRWEFYRRRPDLRAYFDANAERTFEYLQKLATSNPSTGTVLRPDQPGFIVTCDIGLFGYSGIPNPRISEQPASLLLRITGTSSYVACYPGEHYSDLGFALENENQIAFVFELNRPLNRQIEKARLDLEKFQIATAGELLKPRMHIVKWLRYLCVLDADANGVPRSEVAPTLSNTAKTYHASRDTLEQAKGMCFKF
jgi:hypothetical protein